MTAPCAHMEGTALFQYRPLEPGQIRILDIAPDAMARMRHVDLKKSATLKYIALSYTWGASTETFPFECDGQTLPVRENLLLALTRLRYILDTPIWIDAMCINQDNEHEKMGQIQMMTDIYKQAARVLIWLGEEISETKAAVAELRSITTALKGTKPPLIKPDTILPASFVTGIRDLMTRPWWSRLWVLQEATLACEATFVCGSNVIPWKTLSLLAKQIKRLDLYSHFRGSAHSPDFCDGFTEILNTEVVQQSHSTTLETDLIRTCRQRMCFDPCDRVYGVIGLMPFYVRDGFVWEAGATIVDLYPPFVAVLLQTDTSAMLLSLTDTTQRSPNLPSWCPDLHYRSIPNVLADHVGYHAGFTIHTMTKFDWEHFETDPKKLKTKGIVVDTIKTISREDWVDNRVEDLADDGIGHRATWYANMRMLQVYIELAQRFVEGKDLWSMLIGNIIGNEVSNLRWLLAGFSSIHDRLSSWRWKTEAASHRLAFQELGVWQPGAREISSQLQTYLRSARRVCLGRRLFTTEGGRIGLGPRSTAIGDVISIIKNGTVPFVLVRHETLLDTYYLRGEAFVHGLMHREYLKVNKKFGWITLV